MNKLSVGVRLLLGRYLEGLRRYADFSSTTRLVDYLSFFAVNLTIGLSLRALESTSDDGFFELVGLLYGFFVLIPGGGDYRAVYQRVGG